MIWLQTSTPPPQLCSIVRNKKWKEHGGYEQFCFSATPLRHNLEQDEETSSWDRLQLLVFSSGIFSVCGVPMVPRWRELAYVILSTGLQWPKKFVNNNKTLITEGRYVHFSIPTQHWRSRSHSSLSSFEPLHASAIHSRHLGAGYLL